MFPKQSALSFQAPDDLAAALSSVREGLDAINSLLDSLTRSGNSYLDVAFLKADRGEFSYPPWDSVGLMLTSTQTFTTGAWGAVSYDRVLWNTNVLDYSTGASGLLRFTRPSDKRIFLVSGYVQWRYQGTSAGPRGIKLVSYPSAEEIILSQLHGSAVAQSFGAFYATPDGTTAFDIQTFSKETPYAGEALLNVWEIGKR